MLKQFIVLNIALLISTGISSNTVAFEEVQSSKNGLIKIIFRMDKVVMLDVYSEDNPSKIIMNLKDVNLISPINAEGNNPITRIQSSNNGNLTTININLSSKVYWKKPIQIKSDDHVKLILEIKKDRKIKANTRDILIAIDAGHGGKDPGAVGKNIVEKDITLMIAKELERTLMNTNGFSPIMIRKSDEFILLDDRYKIARRMGADILVSLHADAFKLTRVKGASVYVWAKEPSSVTAKNLTRSKSRVAALDAQDFDEDAARNVYIEEYQNKIDNSTRLAKYILSELKKDPFTHMHKPAIEYADFRVLKSIDIPSVLIESGFISNPEDAKRLSDKPGRRMIARGIFLGIIKYLLETPINNTIMSDRPKHLTYEIQKGDVISEIAIRFGVTADNLIEWNNLNNKKIYPGQKIKIFI